MFNFIQGLKDLPGNDLGECAINAVASQSIQHLFTRSELVEVFVRCSPSSKLLQERKSHCAHSGTEIRSV